MTIAVDLGRKATKQTNKKLYSRKHMQTSFLNFFFFGLNVFL